MIQLKHILKFLIIFIPFLLGCDRQNIQVRRLRQHVEYLASDQLAGRYSTTKGDSLSQNYIVRQFCRIGLKPGTDSKSYRQHFPFLTKINCITQPQLLYYSDQDTVRLNRNIDYVIYRESGNTQVDGDVVFLAYGIEADSIGYNDITKLDLSDKIAITYIVTPRHFDKAHRDLAWKYNHIQKAQRLEKMGCRAIIYVNPKTYDKCNMLHSMIDKEHHSQRLRQVGIPICLMTYSTMSRMFQLAGSNLNTIDSLLETSDTSLAFSLRNLKMVIDVNIKRIHKNAANIIGYIPGKNSSTSIVIGAHYDHIGFRKDSTAVDSICNGADDNASGVSLMIELARRCKSIPNWESNLVFVAFGAEESGLCGSNHFIKNIPSQIGDIKSMLNFDMVGRMLNNSVTVCPWNSACEWQSYADLIETGSLIINSRNRNIRADHSPFIFDEIPALLFNTGFHKDYHQVSDEADKLNYEGMQMILDYAFQLLSIIQKPENNLTFSYVKIKNN